MSKKVKSLIEKELKAKLGEVDAVAVLNPRGLDATKNNALRKKLHAKGAKMSVVKNTLAKRAVGEGKLKGFDKLLDGPSAVIYGNVSIAQIARLLLDEKKAEVFAIAAKSLDSAITYANGTDAQSVLMNRSARVTRARVATNSSASTVRVT